MSVLVQPKPSDAAELSISSTVADWFLDAGQRRNPNTVLDSRHDDGLAWSDGNAVQVLVHGAVYFRELRAAVDGMCAGDRLMFTDWRGDPDERLDGPGSEVGPMLAAAARRGVDVRGLVWRSHLDRFQFSAGENRHLGDEVEAGGGQCLLEHAGTPAGLAPPEARRAPPPRSP